MKLVVGLGNPGAKYANTRHNVGFWTIDELASRLGVRVQRNKWQSLYEEVQIAQEKTILLKPQTFMNRTGDAVRAVLNAFHQLRPEEDVIVIYDDMDFAPGQLKLRMRGSAGGHNGMKSVIANMNTSEFARVRIGIGRPRPEDVLNHVLAPFPRDEEPLVHDAVAKAADAIADAINHSFTYAMNQYN